MAGMPIVISPAMKALVSNIGQSRLDLGELWRAYRVLRLTTDWGNRRQRALTVEAERPDAACHRLHVGKIAVAMQRDVAAGGDGRACALIIGTAERLHS